MSRFKRYLSTEIGIDFKACLYTYCILFFLCVYQVVMRRYTIKISVMVEILVITYIMGYLQVYVMNNFDESEQFQIRELFYSILCSLIYTVVSYIGKWYDREIWATVIYCVYMMLCYITIFLVYKIKREIDTKQLNKDLKAFQSKK